MEKVEIKEVNTSIADTLSLRVEVKGIIYSGYLLKE